VLACNAYGDDHLDGTLTYCRQEQQRSAIGEQVLHQCLMQGREGKISQPTSKQLRVCNILFTAPRRAKLLMQGTDMFTSAAAATAAASQQPTRRVSGVLAAEPQLRTQHSRPSAVAQPAAAAHSGGGASRRGGDNIVPQHSWGHATSAAAAAAAAALRLCLRLP
jgi:hypothetical protein